MFTAPTYVVCGQPRSGTTMVMDGCRAGGMEIAKSVIRDQLAAVHSDEKYAVNPNGVQELTLAEYQDPSWPIVHSEKVVKVVVPWLHWMPPHRYRVLFVKRDAEESRQSFEAAFGAKEFPRLSRAEVTQFKADQSSKAIEQLSNRRDVSLTVLDYRRDFIANPRRAFAKLLFAGWPIRVDDAASVVNPALCRFRKEILTVGL